MATRFKTKDAAGRAMLGELRVMQQVSDYEFAVEIWVLRSGVNNNRWDYQNIEKHYLSFAGKPILCAYVGEKIGDGHNMRKTRDPRTGETYYTFTDGTAERIVGAINEAKEDLSLRERDGETWIVAKGRLFSFYAPELVGKIVRTGRMDVSAETEVRGEIGHDGDVEVYRDWIGIGVTILGDDVDPAVPGARIAALSSMEGEFQELKLRAAALRSGTTEKTKKGVENHMNKQAIARLSSKFEGYRIVALSEDGKTVGMVDESGAPYSYRFAKDSGEVITAKPSPAKWVLTMSTGEDTLPADIGDVMEHVLSTQKVKVDAAEALQGRLEEAENTIEAMKKAEMERRKAAVEACAEQALSDMKEMDAEICSEIEGEVSEMAKQSDAYAGMEENGKFSGCEAFRAKAMALFAERQMKKMQEEKRKKESAFAWNFAQGAGTAGDSIEEMLRAINK